MTKKITPPRTEAQRPARQAPAKVAAQPAAMVPARSANKTAAKPAVRARPFRGPRAIGSFIPALTLKAFEKFGFSAVALITDWPQIVGADLAAYTAPEKVKWPRQTEQPPDDDGGKAQQSRADKRGATLHLRVEGPRALEIEYRRQEVADRINAYFGYRAIADVRILQAPISRGPLRKRTKVEAQDRVTLPVVADDGLRSALEKLGSGMKARARQSKPTPVKNGNTPSAPPKKS